ncbi:hypothetical protein ALC57_01236 [Trachymyrmex cornetzi]|uniref:Uncharacterized protein n=1 Tax=Trachymyrmex cornetzi TaxID=471704 RepID=A0A151JQR3_9HYME|nr:hypothetical protein ALC57_01236 [Trachymyrmex cornetzi]
MPISHQDTYVGIMSERNTDCVKENKYLKSQLIAKDKKIADQSQIIEELTTLNMSLQRSVISYFGEFRTCSEKLDEMRSLEGVQTLPVGFIRKTDNTKQPRSKMQMLAARLLKLKNLQNMQNFQKLQNLYNMQKLCIWKKTPTKEIIFPVKPTEPKKKERYCRRNW